MANPTSGENRSTPNPGNLAGFTAEQLRNAAIIAGVGQSLGVGARGIQIAIMTGLMESGLRNVNYGDRDSLGIFQQRGPWGSRSQRLNVGESARMFFTGGAGGQRGLMDINGWQNMDMARAAQAVQVSSSGNYGPRQDDAGRLMAAAGVTPYTTSGPGAGPGAGQPGTATELPNVPINANLGTASLLPNATDKMLDPMASAMSKLLGSTPGSSQGPSGAAGAAAAGDALGIQAGDKPIPYTNETANVSAASYTQP